MSRPTLVPDGHEAIKVLRRVADERLVLRTRKRSGDCTTLVLLTPVPLHFATTLKGVVLRGRGSIEGLPAEVSRTLEGFRVRARVGLEEGIARVVDAGVLNPAADAELAAPPGHGFAWVATAWVEGETLDKAWASLDDHQRHRLLQRIAEGIATLHRHGVFYGDLKPGNVIVSPDREGAVLIDLETLREVPGVDAPVRCLEYTPGYAAPEQEALYEAYLTSDLWSFGTLAASQLTGLSPSDAVQALTQNTLSAEAATKLPPPWMDVLKACLRPMPQARPRASAVAAVLRGEQVGLEGFMDPPAAPRFGAFVKLGTPGGNVDETTRVEDPTPPIGSRPARGAGLDAVTIPDSARTPVSGVRPVSQPPTAAAISDPAIPPAPPESLVTINPRSVAPNSPKTLEVPDPTPPPPDPGSDPGTATGFTLGRQAEPPPPRRRRRPFGRVLVLFTLLAGLAAGAWFGGRVLFGEVVEVRLAQNAVKANQRADQALAALRRHKTESKFNSQTEVERILAEATAAAEIAPTPHALGVQSLALVWSQRWHFSTATWDPDAWALADDLTARALQGETTIHGSLARAMALSASCRLMPSDGRERGRRCRAAQRRFRDATGRLSAIGDEAWLAVEAHWAAEMLESHLALVAFRSDDMGEARRHAAAALEHCEAAWPALDAAPVNGDELNEDCVGAAGWAHDYEAYLRWSDRLLTRRGRTTMSGSTPEIARIFRGGALQCATRDVGSSGMATGNPRSGGWENLCDYVALVALGCVKRAEKERRCQSKVLGLCTRYSKDPDVPWDEAVRAAQRPHRASCLLDAG